MSKERHTVIPFLCLSFLICCSCVIAQEQQVGAPNVVYEAGMPRNDGTTNQPTPNKDDSQPSSIGDQAEGTTSSLTTNLPENGVIGEKDVSQGQGSDRALDDAQTTTSTTGQKPTMSQSKKKTFADVLKANVQQTFELDPRLKKDLTEDNYALRPIKLLQDYYTTGYNPAITWTRQSGQWTTDYSKTNLSLYLVGPVTKHLSGWFQALPLQNTHGFFSHWELFQGMANYGTDKTFVQIRGGQSFNWQNQGFGGADRTITQTSPGVYTAFNGFDPTAVSKTVSADFTSLNWTTGKIFGYWQPGASTSSDSNIAYNRGYGTGLAFEKLFGKTGISGIQSNLTMGNSPVSNGNTNPLGNVIGNQRSPFIWWTSWINRSFQDKQGYVRANPSFGLTVFHVRRFLDDPSIPESPSTGYGYTFDLMTIPVRSYWTSILRFDQFQSTNLSQNTTQYTFTIGQALDLHTPNKGRIRFTFDYQLVGQKGNTPSHRLILGFWPIW